MYKCLVCDVLYRNQEHYFRHQRCDTQNSCSDTESASESSEDSISIKSDYKPSITSCDDEVNYNFLTRHCDTPRTGTDTDTASECSFETRKENINISSLISNNRNDYNSAYIRYHSLQDRQIFRRINVHKSPSISPIGFDNSNTVLSQFYAPGTCSDTDTASECGEETANDFKSFSKFYSIPINICNETETALKPHKETVTATPLLISNISPPSLHFSSPPLKKQTKAIKSVRFKDEVNPEIFTPSTVQDTRKRTHYLKDYTTQDLKDEKKRRQYVDRVNEIVSKQRATIRTLQISNSRWKKKAIYLKSLLKELKRKGLISEIAESTLKIRFKF